MWGLWWLFCESRNRLLSSASLFDWSRNCSIVYTAIALTKFEFQRIKVCVKNHDILWKGLFNGQRIVPFSNNLVRRCIVPKMSNSTFWYQENKSHSCCPLLSEDYLWNGICKWFIVFHFFSWFDSTRLEYYSRYCFSI